MICEVGGLDSLYDNGDDRIVSFLEAYYRTYTRRQGGIATPQSSDGHCYPKAGSFRRVMCSTARATPPSAVHPPLPSTPASPSSGSQAKASSSGMETLANPSSIPQHPRDQCRGSGGYGDLTNSSNLHLRRVSVIELFFDISDSWRFGGLGGARQAWD